MNYETGYKVEIEGKSYTPQNFSIMITTLKVMLKNYLGEKVDKAVIAVPAYFNDAQRQEATKMLSRIAGLSRTYR